MSWRYMAVMQTVDGEEVWTIREVFTPLSWTSTEITPVAESHEELVRVLQMMLKDASQGVFLNLDTEQIEMD